jgi:hypothetical protein
MDMGWGFIYFVLSLIALRYAWDTDARWLGLALVVECALTNMIGLMAPAESSPAINVILDIILMLMAAFLMMRAPILAVFIIILATLGSLLGLAYSAHADPTLLGRYEERANALFVGKCIAVLLTGLWNVVGDSISRFFRWRAHRRHAVDATVRLRLARGRKR